MSAFGVETETNIAPLLEIIIMSSNSSVPVSPDERGMCFWLFCFFFFRPVISVRSVLKFSHAIFYSDALHIASYSIWLVSVMSEIILSVKTTKLLSSL